MLFSPCSAGVDAVLHDGLDGMPLILYEAHAPSRQALTFHWEEFIASAASRLAPAYWGALLPMSAATDLAKDCYWADRDAVAPQIMISLGCRLSCHSRTGGSLRQVSFKQASIRIVEPDPAGSGVHARSRRPEEI